jgi:copper chaperone NosL
MQALPMTTIRRAAWLLALALLAACGGTQAPARHAVDTHADDACAVCGMYLEGSPGPRAQAWLDGRAKPLVFDSTRDFFAYVLQPENQSTLRELYVQDSARIDWQQPTHASASFIDARTAFYVAWQALPGSMGPTLAPFATHAAAEAFVREHGGAVLRFDDLTLTLVAALDYRCPAQVAMTSGQPLQCRAAPAASGLPATPPVARNPAWSAPHG